MRGLYMFVNRKWQEVLEFPRFYAKDKTCFHLPNHVVKSIIRKNLK